MVADDKEMSPPSVEEYGRMSIKDRIRAMKLDQQSGTLGGGHDVGANGGAPKRVEPSWKKRAKEAALRKQNKQTPESVLADQNPSSTKADARQEEEQEGEISKSSSNVSSSARRSPALTVDTRSSSLASNKLLIERGHASSLPSSGTKGDTSLAAKINSLMLDLGEVRDPPQTPQNTGKFSPRQVRPSPTSSAFLLAREKFQSGQNNTPKSMYGGNLVLPSQLLAAKSTKKNVPELKALKSSPGVGKNTETEALKYEKNQHLKQQDQCSTTLEATFKFSSDNKEVSEIQERKASIVSTTAEAGAVFNSENKDTCEGNHDICGDIGSSSDSGSESSGEEESLGDHSPLVGARGLATLKSEMSQRSSLRRSSTEESSISSGKSFESHTSGSCIDLKTSVSGEVPSRASLSEQSHIIPGSPLLPPSVVRSSSRTDLGDTLVSSTDGWTDEVVAEDSHEPASTFGHSCPAKEGPDIALSGFADESHPAWAVSGTTVSCSEAKFVQPQLYTIEPVPAGCAQMITITPTAGNTDSFSGSKQLRSPQVTKSCISMKQKRASTSRSATPEISSTAETAALTETFSSEKASYLRDTSCDDEGGVASFGDTPCEEKEERGEEEDTKKPVQVQVKVEVAHSKEVVDTGDEDFPCDEMMIDLSNSMEQQTLKASSSTSYVQDSGMNRPECTGELPRVLPVPSCDYSVPSDESEAGDDGLDGEFEGEVSHEDQRASTNDKGTNPALSDKSLSPMGVTIPQKPKVEEQPEEPNLQKYFEDEEKICEARTATTTTQCAQKDRTFSSLEGIENVTPSPPLIPVKSNPTVPAENVPQCIDRSLPVWPQNVQEEENIQAPAQEPAQALSPATAPATTAAPVQALAPAAPVPSSSKRNEESSTTTNKRPQLFAYGDQLVSMFQDIALSNIAYLENMASTTVEDSWQCGPQCSNKSPDSDTRRKAAMSAIRKDRLNGDCIEEAVAIEVEYMENANVPPQRAPQRRLQDQLAAADQFSYGRLGQNHKAGALNYGYEDDDDDSFLLKE